LEVAGDAAIGFGVLTRAEASRNFLLDLAHAQVTLGAVVGKGHLGTLGEQQHRRLVALEAFPEVMRIGLCHPSAFSMLARRDGWQLLRPTELPELR
jgi:hypothetical protein